MICFCRFHYLMTFYIRFSNAVRQLFRKRKILCKVTFRQWLLRFLASLYDRQAFGIRPSVILADLIKANNLVCSEVS